MTIRVRLLGSKKDIEYTGELYVNYSNRHRNVMESLSLVMVDGTTTKTLRIPTKIVNKVVQDHGGEPYTIWSFQSRCSRSKNDPTVFYLT